MGIGNSQQQQILQKAQKFRQNLHERVQTFRAKYKQEFSKIDAQLKDKVIISSATELIELIEQKQVTSYEIVLIFAERTSKIGIQGNHVLEEMFEEALQMARQCDEARQKEPLKRNWKGDHNDREKCFPPFYGIPASYKENIRLKGRSTYLGFVVPHEQNYPQQENGLFAQITIRMGFIPFCRTTVPPGCKSNDTNNLLLGYCKNPWNKERSCGGSSGGEGGLIASHCSPIGFGTDIGGSLRIPAEYNGLMTLKPGQRYSRMGNSFYGKLAAGTPIKSDLGPLTRSVKDIELFMKCMCDEKNYECIPAKVMDPYLNLKPWKSQAVENKKKLKIGYIIHLETLKCSPSHERVVQQAVSILRQSGHQITQIKLPRFQQLYFSMVQLYSAPGNLSILNEISPHQPLIPQYKLLNISTKIPNFVKTMVSWMLSSRQPRMVKMMNSSRSMTVKQVYEKIYQMQNELTQLIYSQFVDNQLDAIVMPGFAHPSPKCGTAHKLQYTISYTMGWNVLNYPAGSVPMSLVKENQQHYDDPYNDSVTRAIKETINGSEGLPVGVQVVSLPFREETVVKVMYQLEEKVQFRKNYPCTKILQEKL